MKLPKTWQMSQIDFLEKLSNNTSTTGLHLVFLSLRNAQTIEPTTAWTADSSPHESTGHSFQHWATNNADLISLPKERTRWQKRVSNTGPLDPESYALPLHHTGWARKLKFPSKKRSMFRNFQSKIVKRPSLHP